MLERFSHTCKILPGVSIRAMSWDPVPWDLLWVWVPLVFWLLEGVWGLWAWQCQPQCPLTSHWGSFFISRLQNGDAGKEIRSCR